MKLFMTKFFLRAAFPFFIFHFSFFISSAQSVSLKTPYSGLSWSGPLNSFSRKADSSHTFIFSSAHAYLNGNTLPFQFSQKIFQSAFLTNEIKDNATKRLHNINVAEGGYSYSAGFCTHLKKHFVGMEVSDQSISMLTYRRDLFQLVFNGNAQFEDDTAFMRGTGLANQDFHRVRFMFSTISGAGDSSLQINAALSYLQGYHVNSLNVGNTRLYTAPMGEYLWLRSQFVYQTNDTSSFSTFAFNGNGVSADIAIAFPAGKSQLMFSINDAGFISWNKKSLFYGMDTTVTFDGVELENILVNSSAALDSFTTDSLFNYLGVSRTHDAFNLNLPLRFSFSWNKLLHENKVALSAGFTFRPQYENLPVFYCSSAFLFNHFSPTVSVSYGGLQRFNMGLFLEGKICKHFNYTLGTGQTLSWLLPKQLNGVDGFVKVGYSF